MRNGAIGLKNIVDSLAPITFLLNVHNFFNLATTTTTTATTTTTTQSPLQMAVEALRMAAAPATAVGLIGVANMVIPQLISSAPLSGSAPLNFAGPQPGTPGGGFLPSAVAQPEKQCLSFKIAHSTV